jgi:hypothetical protein
LTVRNNQLNCALLKSNPDAELNNTDNNTIIVEIFYDQPQLLGVPLISNAVTDPIPLYSHTAMRMITSRDADASEVIGPICELYPMAVRLADVTGLAPGDPLNLTQEGGAAPNFTWVVWDSTLSGADAEDFVVESLSNPRLAINQFVDAGGGDELLTADGTDQLALLAGQNPGSGVEAPLQALVGATVRAPVIDAGDNVIGIAWLSINQVDLGVGREIRTTFNGYDNEACMQ